MNKKAIWSLIVVIVVAIGALSVYLGRGHETGNIQPILIGQMSGLTGTGADIGAEERNGTLLAIEQINERGGIAGRKLQMISEDAPPFDLKKGASAAQKLISADNVMSIIGPQWDGQGELMASMSASQKVPVISQNVSTDIESKISSPYFFVTWPSDEEGIKKLLGFAQLKGWKKISIIQPANFSFWLFTTNLMKQNAAAYGIEIISTEMGNDFGNVDYRTLITKTKARKPDAVFGAFAELECAFLKQMQEQGMNVPLLSTDSAGSPKAIVQCANLLEGRLFYATMSKGNGYDAFAAAYTTRFGHGPISPSAATAYNAVMVLADVMKKLDASGTPITRENIRAGLKEVDFKDAVSIGEIRFNDKGYVITPSDAYQINMVKAGKFVKAE